MKGAADAAACRLAKMASELLGREGVCLDKDNNMYGARGGDAKALAEAKGGGRGRSGVFWRSDEKGLTGRDGGRVGDRRFGPSRVGGWDRYGVCRILWRGWVSLEARGGKM